MSEKSYTSDFGKIDSSSENETQDTDTKLSKHQSDDVSTERNSLRNRTVRNTTRKHPIASKMVFDALKNLEQSRKGQSLYAIKKYIASNFSIDNMTKYKRYLNDYLRRAVQNGDIIQTKRSYKLPPKSVIEKKLRLKKKESQTKQKIQQTTENKAKLKIKWPFKLNPNSLENEKFELEKKFDSTKKIYDTRQNKIKKKNENSDTVAGSTLDKITKYHLQKLYTLYKSNKKHRK